MLIQAVIRDFQFMIYKCLNQGNAPTWRFILVAAEVVGWTLRQAQTAFHATISEVRNVIIAVQAGRDPVAE